MRRPLLFLVLLSLVATAAVTKDAEFSRQTGVDFSTFTTYAWAPHEGLVDGHPLAEGSPLDLRIKEAADEQLSRKGYRRVAPSEAHDLLINYVGYGRDYLDVEGTTREITGGVKWIGDVNAHSMRSYREGTLVFEAVAPSSGTMVWSGWVTELAPNVQKLQAKAEKATRSVMKHFPER